MKISIKVTQEVDVRELHVDAGVRYWEDTDINGNPDTEGGDHIPCKNGDRWQPAIDLESGRIKNWEKGKTANVHYKVCDDGIYTLVDRDGNAAAQEEGYVPKIMCPADNGYGDYIIMEINADGMIQDWKVDLSDFINEED